MQEQAAPAEACYPREAGRLHPRCAAPNNLPGTSLPDPINQTTTPGARCPPEPVDSTPCLGFRAFDPLTNRRRAARTPQNRREYSTGTAKSPCPPRRNGHCCGCRPPAMQRCVPLAHARGTPEKNLWHRCHKNSMISSSIFFTTYDTV
jgi:hypothetical protein